MKTKSKVNVPWLEGRCNQSCFWYGIMFSTHLAMFLAKQSLRQISPIPGKWFILWGK